MKIDLGELFTQEFASISAGQLLTALGLALVLSLYVVLVYRLAYTGVLFSKRFALSLVLLCLITSTVILVISSNVVLSLGMVGALSIVRFRTAVKDAMDTVFMFWAIVVGIITGARFILISVIATIFIGAVLLAVFFFVKRIKDGSYLVVLRVKNDCPFEPLLKTLPAYKIKSRCTNERMQELVLEMRLSEKLVKGIGELVKRDEVFEVNTVAYNSQSGL